MTFPEIRITSSNWVIFLILTLIALGGCSGSKGNTGKSYSMGEPAVVGPLTYNVVETEWKETLDGAMGPRVPKHRFLLVNLSISSSAEKEVSVPFLTLIDAKGEEIREEDKGEGVAAWLGYLRQVGPAEPLHGRILFDVPQGGYKLRITSGGDIENETTAVVDLPFRADAPVVRPMDPAGVPSSGK